MKAFNYTIILLNFFYFFTLITGIFGPGLSPEKPIRAENIIESQNQAREDFQIDPSLLQKDHLDHKGLKTTWEWQPGYYQKFMIHSSSIALFNDALLENDSRPGKLFNKLERSYAAIISRLILTGFWCMSLCLLLVTLLKNQWFYRPMSSMVFLISVFVIMIILSTDRKVEINRFAESTSYHIVMASFELILVFMTITLLLIRTLPYKKLELKFEFMDHLRLPSTRIPERIIAIFKTTFHIFVIIICGLIISNLLLLPVYKIQVNFQGVFAIILAIAISILALWYIKAYISLMKEKTGQKDIASGITFLGYRLLKNTLFIGTVIIIVAIVLTIIVIISTFNTELLQYLGLIPIQESL